MFSAIFEIRGEYYILHFVGKPRPMKRENLIKRTLHEQEKHISDQNRFPFIPLELEKFGKYMLLNLIRRQNFEEQNKRQFLKNSVF